MDSGKPMSIDELLQFEDQEQDQFLEVVYPAWNGEENLGEYIKRAFFPGLGSDDYQLLKQETKQGLKEGVRMFLQQHNPALRSLYEADLSTFCLDDSTEGALKSRLERTKFVSEQYVADYCREISRGYRVFVYNDSYNKLEKMLNAERAAASASMALRASG